MEFEVDYSDDEDASNEVHQNTHSNEQSTFSGTQDSPPRFSFEATNPSNNHSNKRSRRQVENSDDEAEENDDNHVRSKKSKKSNSRSNNQSDESDLENHDSAQKKKRKRSVKTEAPTFSRDELLNINDVPAINDSVNQSIRETNSHIGGDETKQIAEAGIITSLELKNFMSHSFFTIEFNPHITFITGRNGSGKSAILHALQTVFGCRAVETTRGSSLSSFIRWESKERQATITVNIKNKGEMPWKPRTLNKQEVDDNESVGDSIFLRRTLTGDLKNKNRCSSAYHLRILTTQHNGVIKESWQKIHAHDVQALCDYFNIQPSNPCVVLNQETSKKFLAKDDEHKKYEFFTRATQLDILKAKHDECEKRIKQIMAEVLECRPRMHQLRDEHVQLSKFVNYIKDRDTVAERMKETAAAVAFKELELAEAKYEKELGALSQALAKVDRAAEELEAVQSEGDQYAQEKARRNQMRLEADRELDGVRTALSRAEQAADQAGKRVVELDKKVARLQTSLQDAQRRHHQREAEIKKMSDTLNAQNADENSERERQMAEFQDQLQKYQAQEQALKAERKQAEQQARGVDEEVREIDRRMSNVRSQVTEFDRQLNDLKSRQSSGNRFGAKATEIRQLINQSNHFQNKPLGPLGDYVKLREGMQQWALAVETCLGRGNLQGYLVDRIQDRDILKAIFRRVGLRDSEFPLISVRAYEDNKQYQDPGPEHHPFVPHQRVLDCMTVDNNWAYNSLIDAAGPESTLVLSAQNDREDSTSIGRRGQQIIKHFQANQTPLRQIITVTGQTISGRGGATTFINEVSRGQSLLVSDMRAEFNRVNESRGQSLAEMDVLKRDRETRITDRAKAQKLISNIDARIADASGAIADVEAERAELQRQMRSRRSEQDLVPLQARVDQALNEINEINGQIEELMNQRQDRVDKHQIALGSVEDARAVYGECQRALSAAESSCSELDANQSRRANLIETKQRAYMNLKQRTDTQRAYIQDEEAKLNTRRTQTRAKHAPFTDSILVADLTLDQYKVAARDADVAFRKVDFELQEFKKKFPSLNDDAIIERYKSLSKNKLTLEANYYNIKRDWKLFNECLLMRRKKFAEYQQALGDAINKNYNMYMTQNGRRGRVAIDHATQSLRVSSEPLTQSITGNSASTSVSLSGGEKSYSTVSFLMSLWRVVACPWQAMDEFDVYQDTINRDKSMDLLIRSAARTINRQFLFLTPLDVSKIKQTRIISIRQLAPPDRGQTHIETE